MSLPRIKLRIEGSDLFAFYAIAHEFTECGKASRIGLLPNASAIQNFKFNDADFRCVYHSIIRAMNSDRYPVKKGKEYLALCRLKEYFENAYLNQRNRPLNSNFL